MNLRLICLALATLFLPAPPPAPAAAPPPWTEPLRGVVTSGAALVCAKEDGYLVRACVAPLGAGGPAATVDVSMSTFLPARWHVGHGAFWVHYQLGLSEHDCSESLDRYELTDLLRGKAVTGPGAPEGKPRPAFAYPTPGGLAHWLSAVDFDFVRHYDSLPVGPHEVRQFLLINVRGKVVPAAKTDKLRGYRLLLTDKDKEAPHWSFTVHAYKGEWDAKEKEWREGKWVEEESLPVAFKESFQVVGKGEDYYFVTRSGRLFAAKKPPKGKARKVEAVWDDPRRRIAAFLTDADSGRTFLFCRPAGPGRQPTYFELGGRPRLTPYDPASVKAPKADEPLKTALTCARVLLADKKVKLPPAKK